MKAAELFDPEMIETTERDLFPFRSQIADREQVRCALALARQKRIALAESKLRRAHLDGIGEVVATIDADIYHRLGLMYGYETVNSDDFLRALLRDNPDLRVKSHSRHARVVVPAGFEPVPAPALAPAEVAAVDTVAQPITDGELG